MLDLHIWPFFEKLALDPQLQAINAMPKDTFPKLQGWMVAMQGTQAAKLGGTDMKYYGPYQEESKKGGRRPYDIGIE